jgi:hypothetical protein
MSNVRYAAQAVWQLKAILCMFLAGPALAEKKVITPPDWPKGVHPRTGFDCDGHRSFRR